MATIAKDLRIIVLAIMTNRVDGHGLRPLNPIGFSRGCYSSIFGVTLILVSLLALDSIFAQTQPADLTEMLQRTARTVSPAIVAIGHVGKHCDLVRKPLD